MERERDMSLPEAILRERIIPVARGLDARTAPALAGALRAGGISLIEITVEGVGGIEAISAVSGQGSTVGGGTIVTVAQARSAVAAGAEFLVSPHLDEALLKWASAEGVPMIPGVFTPTEIAMATAHRPPAVKVFPAHLGGPGYLKSLLAPYPELNIIPTGGIDGDNIVDYLAAGAVAVGVGGWLTGHDDLATVTRRAAHLVRQVV
jgi:2-dehydro-3-deoxyphosphogluconate aldolase / (4S)-4-hydroxy-2-oxoglutarate aldolase